LAEFGSFFAFLRQLLAIFMHWLSTFSFMRVAGNLLNVKLVVLPLEKREFHSQGNHQCVDIAT
jgi:hypothetical protein